MIEGKLVRLRAIELDDAERAYRWMNDREVTRYLMARYPMSRETEKEWVQNASKPLDYTGVRLAIETKDGVHIGNCGLHRGRVEDRNAELGIGICEKEYWGRGFGTDTMMTLVRFAFEQMNLNKVTLGVFEFNERGHNTYRKVGFVEEGRAREDVYQDGRYWDVIRMSILRREFEALHGPLGATAAATDGATPI
ncbi:MAG TPA: GNAT family protein [Dehalococcoidia bacterium]|nr:GNAT family protein [Dehalococcoidia bacterium]